MERMILACGAAGLPQPGPEGFYPIGTPSMIVSLFRQAGLWIGPREALEKMPLFRQLIPYVVVKVGNRFVRYTRAPKGDEQRLHGKMSIGVGGHIDHADITLSYQNEVPCIDLPATLSYAAIREVDEEISGAHPRVEVGTLGLILDDVSDVGKVHVGIASVWEVVARDEVIQPKANDPSIGSVELVTLEQIFQDFYRLEDWSKTMALQLRRMSLG